MSLNRTDKILIQVSIDTYHVFGFLNAFINYEGISYDCTLFRC